MNHDSRIEREYSDFLYKTLEDVIKKYSIFELTTFENKKNK